MANGIGDSKNSIPGPCAGPKRNPLKQTPPANARQYYNSSKVPGVTKGKTKTPSRSPSAEPTDESDSPEVTMERPTTPISNTTPAIETTPRAQRTSTQTSSHADEDEHITPRSIDMGIGIAAAAANHDLDYGKINECMYNVLQDVDNILLNQMSDVFDLPKWVTNMVNLLDLKVCDKYEWKLFNDHYNRETGELTAHKPYETIGPPNDTVVSIADRDELSKVRVELTMANTTIKNLSEAVVNFSHNKNLLVPQQDKKEITPQTPASMTNPLPNTMPDSQWVKSANLTIIKLTQNAMLKSPQTSIDATSKPKANPHHLILQFNPSIPEPERKNGDIA